MDRAIVIIGFKHAGKTTIGQKLAQELRLDFIDTDALLLKQSQFLTISEMYQVIGEKEFRLLESQKLKGISFLEPKVIATGGGTVFNQDNDSYLKQGMIVFVDTPFKMIWERLKNKSFLGESMDERVLYSLYQKRKKVYSTMADFHFNPKEMCLEDLIREITCLATA